jgi:hypothetical protein
MLRGLLKMLNFDVYLNIITVLFGFCLNGTRDAETHMPLCSMVICDVLMFL